MTTYKLPLALKHRLESLEYSEENIQENINKYEEQAKSYIKARVNKHILDTIDNDTLTMFTENYIQYNLFALVEMEGLVEDKKIFIDELIKGINDNYKQDKEDEKEKNKQKRRIYVY